MKTGPFERKAALAITIAFLSAIKTAKLVQLKFVFSKSRLQLTDLLSRMFFVCVTEEFKSIIDAIYKFPCQHVTQNKNGLFRGESLKCGAFSPSPNRASSLTCYRLEKA